MKKKVCLEINQLIWITLHRLATIVNVGLRHTHSVCISSERNETKILRLLF